MPSARQQVTITITIAVDAPQDADCRHAHLVGSGLGWTCPVCDLVSNDLSAFWSDDDH